MKRLMFVVISTIGLSIGLSASAGSDVSKGVLAIAAVSHTDTGTISRSGTEANGNQEHQKQTFIPQQGWSNSQTCEPVQSEGVLMPLFAQTGKKKICSTPEGTCTVRPTARIGSSCCCPNGACGRVVYE